METFTFDFLTLLSFSVFAGLFIGTVVGLIIGALPGLGASIAVILLLPFTYSLDPLIAVLMLLAAYQSAEYGGSISAIIIGVPGTGAAVPTLLDGHAMAKNGQPGKALVVSLFSSFVGGLVGGLALLFLTVPLSKFALKLSEPEYFLIGVLALFAVASLSSKNIVKGLIFAVLGLFVGTVGMDVFTGTARFTFGRPELMEGLNIVALLVGMFAFPEIFKMINDGVDKRYLTDVKGVKMQLGLQDLKQLCKPIGAGSIIGTGVGIFPGLGTGVSSWLAYFAAKKISKSPQTFGKGNPAGIAGPESANNATVGGSLIPLLTLGIPGSPGIAIVAGAFIIHGIQPGPGVISSEPELVYGIFYGFLLTAFMMLIVGLFLTRLFSRVLMVPNYYMIPILLILCLVGVYASKGLLFELWIAFILGIIFYYFEKLDYSLPAFILAFVLSPIIEESLRRTLILSQGSYMIFFQRAYSIIILFIILAIIIGLVVGAVRKRYNAAYKLNA